MMARKLYTAVDLGLKDNGTIFTLDKWCIVTCDVLKMVQCSGFRVKG